MSEKQKKLKILTLSDQPLGFSGVGLMARSIIEAWLKTGRYQVISLAGAEKHASMQPIKTDEYADDWIIFPVVGMGDPMGIRSILHVEKPDILWFMTDPRQFEFLWMMEDEIRPLIPMVYNTIWDNFPVPLYNKKYYDSTDVLVSISKVTNDIIKALAPEAHLIHQPHAVDPDVYKKYPDEDVQAFAKEVLGEQYNPEKKIFFWNNRNARRKHSGTLIYWFKEFLNIVGHDKAQLIMHTFPHDLNGPDLIEVMKAFGLDKGQLKFSTGKYPPEKLAMFYNMAQATINISDAEGFGLGTLESLSCGTPIVVTMTGGLQEQVTDGKNWFGEGIEPTSKMLVGSQNIPYIYEDRISLEDFLGAMKRMYELTPDQRKKLGEAGQQHVYKNYNYKQLQDHWVRIMDDIHEKYGSWNTRKGYNRWELKEL